MMQKHLHIGIAASGRICGFNALKTLSLNNDTRGLQRKIKPRCLAWTLFAAFECSCMRHVHVLCCMLYICSTMTTLSQTKELFRRAEAVCFDVDSTVIKEEGIDELAKFCGVGDAVTEMYACCRNHTKVCSEKYRVVLIVSRYFSLLSHLGLGKLWVDP